MKIPIALALLLALSPGAVGGQTMHAKGNFDVKVQPMPGKQYHGALDATANGEMFAAGNQKAGSAGYVTPETFTGALDGRDGTFSLMQLA